MKEESICKSILLRFYERLLQNEDLVLLSDTNYLTAYRSMYKKDVEPLLEVIKEHKNCSVRISNAGEKMLLDYTEKAVYVGVISNGCDLCIWNNENNIRIYADSRTTYNKLNITKFCFFQDGNIMQSSSVKKGIYFPASLRSIGIRSNISFIFSVFVQAYLEVMSDLYPVFKDVLRNFYEATGNLYAPIPINAIIGGRWASYQIIFDNHYKLNYKVPKMINKMTLREAYIKVMACKYVNPNEIQKIMELPLKDANDEIDLFLEYYRPLAEKVCTNKGLSHLEPSEKIEIVRDYIRMAVKVDKRVCLTMKSFRTIMDKHNELVTPYMRKFKGKKMTIPKDSPYRKLKLPDNYTLIKTGTKLYQEGLVMHHCVYSYREYVNHGDCVILHIDYEEQPYTAEIRIRNKRKRNPNFYCKQLYGPYDTPGPKQLWSEIEIVLQENNSILKIT